jgi:L,D-peptidoglycan transpeptidase YkuD (ErfK/YbiS/YcfS/YnhG family)
VPCADFGQVRQLVVSIAPEWNSKNGRLQCFERSGSGWQAALPAWPVLYGKNGLAWGRGVKGADEPGRRKSETRRARSRRPFSDWKIYTYDATLPSGAQYPFHTVTKRDAWVDDIHSPHYNQHVVIDDPENPPPWFEKQKMRHNDFAYRWLVEIRHNADPPLPGAGSAIFFHIRRGTQRPTAGCTTMA